MAKSKILKAKIFLSIRNPWGFDCGDEVITQEVAMYYAQNFLAMLCDAVELVNYFIVYHHDVECYLPTVKYHEKTGTFEFTLTFNEVKDNVTTFDWNNGIEVATYRLYKTLCAFVCPPHPEQARCCYRYLW